MKNNTKNADNVILAISNVLMVVFVSTLLRGHNIISLLILLAWAVYASQNKMILPKSLERKRTKFEYGSFIVLLIGFMLIYYHPNKVYVFLTYLTFFVYNTLLWMNMIRMRAINKENNKKSNKKK
ncbi:hypothetical protein [Finegoldia magna]|uniref:hypothetical protein n=1 Tax=Finegoldia magna TaxID=1260 RepID=UPI0028051C7B|nr:hypothetical protein [Finegoldia magna]MDU5070861.1 hypothetical protein [Finegoldia magna]